MAIDPAISALVQAEQQIVVSADAALRASRPTARTSAAASLLAIAADAQAECDAQRQTLSRATIDATVRTAGDRRALLFKAVRLPAGSRIIGGRRAFVRGIRYDPVEDRTDLLLIVEAA